MIVADLCIYIYMYSMCLYLYIYICMYVHIKKNYINESLMSITMNKHHNIMQHLPRKDAPRLGGSVASLPRDAMRSATAFPCRRHL